MIDKCPVPGCDRTDFKSANALGPHLAWHRKQGHEGVPPESESARKAREAYHRKQKELRSSKKKNLPAVIDSGAPTNGMPEKFHARDVVDMGLLMMYRKSVPREDVYDLAKWVEQTEAVAKKALGG